jgi:hypothetical protein
LLSILGNLLTALERVAPVKTNMVNWGKTNSDDLYCGCGEVQDMGLSCRDCPQNCTLEDLWLANKKGFDVAQLWEKKYLI